MKKAKFALLLGLTTSVLLTSCSTNEQANGTEQTEQKENTLTKDVSQRVLDAATKLRLNTNHIQYDDFYFPDGTSEPRLIIENDIAMTEAQLFELAKSESEKPGRQYRTYNLVSQGRNITILGYTGGGGYGLSSKARTGLTRAVANYNNLGLSIKFTLTFGTDFGSKDMVVYNNPNNSGAGGSAGFPSGGRPHKWNQIHGLDSYSTAVNEHVITHEIGHSVGFRHTDWNTRQSCGQSGEGVGSNGAVHIPGTPTGYDSTSLMLACFHSGVSGNFNSNDVRALKEMY